jgi:hypothetical protein
MNNAHPQFSTQQIERIVHEVVARLTDGSAQIAQLGNLTKTENHVGSAGTLTLSERVISTETLGGKLANVSQVRLQPKAVLTPAARDELRDKGIEVTFDHAVATTSRRTNLILGTTNESNAPQLVERLARIGIQAQLKHDTCARRLVANLTTRFSTTARLIAFVDQPYTATCVANRNQNVRAAVVRDEAELKMVTKEINPNVIVIPADRATIVEAVAKALIS